MITVLNNGASIITAREASKMNENYMYHIYKGGHYDSTLITEDERLHSHYISLLIIVTGDS